MTDKERDRIESAIRHIQTAVDVDPWAMEIAVEAMRRQIKKDDIRESTKMMDGTISRQVAIEAIKEDKIDLADPNMVAVFKATGDFEKAETQVMTENGREKVFLKN